MLFRKLICFSAFILGLILPCVVSISAEENQYMITIKDHRFSPDVLTIPANAKIQLFVVNQDPTPEEFESYDFNREKVVPGNGAITVFIGPLKPGRYQYFGEFNKNTAQGVIVAE